MWSDLIVVFPAMPPIYWPLELLLSIIALEISVRTLDSRVMLPAAPPVLVDASIVVPSIFK